MTTYFVKTTAQKGPRSTLSEKWIVVADSEALAANIALSQAAERSKIASIEQVETIRRISIG